MTALEALRADLRLLAGLVPEGSRVLDLGCGDGALLEHLRDERACAVYGIEISPAGVAACVRKGVPVIQANLDDGLRDFPDGSFDVVICSQTLQEVHNISLLFSEVMRVGTRMVVSYPNFAHAGTRIRLGLRGRLPVSDALPYQWYDTPNVHYTTIPDFRALCETAGLEIEREVWLRVSDGRVTELRWAPNLRAELAIAVVASREKPGAALSETGTGIALTRRT